MPCQDPKCVLPNPHEGNCDVNPPVTVDYTNYKKRRSIRRISPTGAIKFMSVPPWHEDEQWVFGAIDHEDGKHKWFAASGLHSWTSDGRRA